MEISFNPKTQYVIQNTGKTPVKYQYRKFLYIIEPYFRVKWQTIGQQGHICIIIKPITQQDG